VANLDRGAYGAAMTALAIIGVVGFGAALLLPSRAAEEPVVGPAGTAPAAA
jgi:hypothetical protein